MLIEIKVKKPVKVPTSYDTSVGEVNCNSSVKNCSRQSKLLTPTI